MQNNDRLVPKTLYENLHSYKHWRELIFPVLIYIISLCIISILLYFSGYHFWIIFALIFSLLAISSNFIYTFAIKPDIRIQKLCQKVHYNTSPSSKQYNELDDILLNIENVYESGLQQQLLQKQALIQSLQSQINPHFLYNTLDSIRGQALEENSRETADMIGALSAFFRYTISSKQDIVTLEQEFRNVENYMKIQQYRFTNRFSLHIEIPSDLENSMNYRVPKLILQPIVENAINHGLQSKKNNGIVTISLKPTQDLLVISINDNGIGMDESQLIRLNQELTDNYATSLNPYNDGSGIALKNVHARIRLMFGERYGLHVYSALGIGTTVEMTLPLEKE